MGRKHISSELRDWIIATLQSGVRPEAIVDAMIKKGFDSQFAYTTLFRLISNRPVQNTKESSVYLAELPDIDHKGKLIQMNDREVKVLLRIEKPYILYLENVLSASECAQLIQLAKLRLEPSTVIDQKTGLEKKTHGRTSKGMAFAIRENPLVTQVEERIAQLTNYSIQQGEGLQILNYQPGEEYKAHYDFFPANQVEGKMGGQRIATFLIYLNDVPAGGETVFPKANLSFTPKKGSALFFHYGNSKGQVDRLSLHSSVPVSQGEKWVATKWIRQGNIYGGSTRA